MMADTTWRVKSWWNTKMYIQRDNFNSIRPLLDLVGKRRDIIVSPMPRYVIWGCCGDDRHVTNHSDSNYHSSMLAALQEARKNLKDFLFQAGKRNFRILDPNMDIRSMSDEDILGVDQVHPLLAVYSKIADSAVKLAESTKDSSEHKRRRMDSLEAASSHEDNRRSVSGNSQEARGRGNTGGWQPSPSGGRGAVCIEATEAGLSADSEMHPDPVKNSNHVTNQNQVTNLDPVTNLNMVKKSESVAAYQSGFEYITNLNLEINPDPIMNPVTNPHKTQIPDPKNNPDPDRQLNPD
jgi:hypothetical protein